MILGGVTPKIDSLQRLIDTEAHWFFNTLGGTSMKKETLIWSMFLSFFIDLVLHAATDELQHVDRPRIDRFKLAVRTDHIVGSLWRNEIVLDEDIESFQCN